MCFEPSILQWNTNMQNFWLNIDTWAYDWFTPCWTQENGREGFQRPNLPGWHWKRKAWQTKASKNLDLEIPGPTEVMRRQRSLCRDRETLTQSSEPSTPFSTEVSEYWQRCGFVRGQGAGPFWGNDQLKGGEWPNERPRAPHLALLKCSDSCEQSTL